MKGFRKRRSVLDPESPMWRKAGTIISQRLLPFSFRVASMLSQGGKSLRRHHCAPMRSHDCRIATHRRRVLCVVGVTGTVEIFIGDRHYYYVTYRDYIGPLRLGGSIQARVNARISVRDVRLRELVVGETNHHDKPYARYTLFSRVLVEEHDGRSRVINYYVLCVL